MITVVSGLPRSGTSLMMQILHNGGMEILSDYLRKEDINNPRGYYEYEKVKTLPKDSSWLIEADGKVIKVIAQLIHYLPISLNYNVIFMERNIEEILLSQDKMIDQLKGNKPVIDKNILKTTFEKQVEKTKNYIKQSPSFNLLTVNYHHLLFNNKETLNEINSFLGKSLNIDSAKLAVDLSLYRNKLI